MNIRATINKLQKALIQRGKDRGMKIPKYIEMSAKDVELMNGCSQVEVLKWFVGE